MINHPAHWLCPTCRVLRGPWLAVCLVCWRPRLAERAGYETREAVEPEPDEDEWEGGEQTGWTIDEEDDE